MNELQIFNSPEFGDIRTATLENEPMFCLSDVCRALEITNVGNVKQRLSEKGIRTMDTLTKGGNQKLLTSMKLICTKQYSKAEKNQHNVLQIG